VLNDGVRRQFLSRPSLISDTYELPSRNQQALFTRAFELINDLLRRE
jgi:hypothetical protein